MTREKDTDSDRLAIANRLRTAREAAGLTQGQVAVKLSLHRPTISEIEAGRRKVSAEELMTLADLYGVDVKWLVNPGKNKTSPDKILLAARQLSKLKDKDLNRLLKLVQMLRGSGDTNELE
jgi:transcriptional regulator with XRE-family HTH domain